MQEGHLAQRNHNMQEYQHSQKDYPLEEDYPNQKNKQGEYQNIWCYSTQKQVPYTGKLCESSFFVCSTCVVVITCLLKQSVVM